MNGVWTTEEFYVDGRRRSMSNDGKTMLLQSVGRYGNVNHRLCCSIANVLLLSVYLNQLICICYTDVKCHALMRNKETGRYKLGSLKGWRLFPICCPY